MTGDGRASLSSYLRVRPSGSFDQFVRSEACILYFGDAGTIPRQIPAYVASLNRYGNSASVLTKTKEEMVTIALIMAAENHRKGPKNTESFEHLSV